MKICFNLLMFMFLLGAAQTQAQTIYVNAAASGANSGASWANAYQKLSDGLKAAAAPGAQVWVAAGTYAPDSFFVVNPGVQLYGGFAGTETALSQRNAQANPTILSGDRNKDDVAGSYTTNRTDNAIHILWLRGADTVSRAVVDGFTIRNGHTANSTTSDDGRGAAVFLQTKATLRNCLFTANWAVNGIVSASTAGASQILADNCTFDRNFVTERSMIHLISLRSAEINRCTFTRNNVSRGNIYPQTSLRVRIDSCLFESNIGNATFSGTGIFSFASDFNVTNCIFSKNKSAADAGVMLINGNNQANRFLIDNCLFEKDSCTGSGAALRIQSTAVGAIQNSVFRGNFATGSGGAMLIVTASVVDIKNTTYEDNSCQLFGGVMSSQSLNTQVNFDNCTFKGNKSNTRSGGAFYSSFIAGISVKNSTFEKNSCVGLGGAIATQNDSTRLVLNGCKFIENSTPTSSGGALYFRAGGKGEINDCLFLKNSADFGAGIAMTSTRADVTILQIKRSSFIENGAATQAGGINIDNVPNLLISDCLFAKNVGPSVGGAISNNASGTDTSRVRIINTTFAENASALGGGIAQYEANDTCKAIIILQNSIFATNVTENYVIEKGNATLTSLGGNLCAEEDMAAFLTGPNDANNVDPKFKDPQNNDFSLLNGSPCINTGVATGASSTDILGNPRVGLPDKGCYELQSVGVFQPFAKALPLQVAPNPSSDRATMTLENNWSGPVVVRLFAPDGALVRSETVGKTAGEWTYTLQLGNLPVGTYRASVQMGAELYAGALSKM